MELIEQLLTDAAAARQQGAAHRARELYGRALQIDPHQPLALRRLAWLEDDLGDLPAAIALLQKLIALQPTDARAWQDLGLCLRRSGQLQEASERFRRATELEPTYAPAFCNLGLVLEDLGDQPGAVRALQRAAELQPDSGFIAFHLATVSGSTDVPVCPREYLVQLFDGYADRFDQHLFETLSYRGPALLADIVAGHGPPRPWDIIDIGCGTGMTAVPFRAHARSILGVDLSAGMLRQAARRITADGRPFYDALLHAEIVTTLQQHSASFDLVLSADVFIYIGDLRPVLAASHAALRPGGLIAFTTETTQGPKDFCLLPTRRYAQSPAYIARLADELRFKIVDHRQAQLRLGEDGKPIVGDVYLLQRSEP